MRTASECLAMAVRMDGYAARNPDPHQRAEWAIMASHWRGLARQADWQDRYAARAV
jgi:hypothetical protein